MDELESSPDRSGNGARNPAEPGARTWPRGSVSPHHRQQDAKPAGAPASPAPTSGSKIQSEAPGSDAPRQGQSSSLGNGSTMGKSLPKASILLVDDRPDKLLAIESILSSLGQNIVQARSGKDALRHILRQDFAVILLDVSMPCMDGFETAALIRKRANSEHTPIIFITSINSSDNHIAQGYSLGAVDYMLTPIVPEILRSKVSAFVELFRRSELIKQQGEELRRFEESKHRRELSDVADRLETETRRNRFFTLALDLLAIASFDDYFIQLNPVWSTTLGFDSEELKSKSLIEFVHPEDRTRTAEQLMQLKLGSAPVYFENRYRCRDGSFRWLGWTAAPFPEEQLVYIFARDITERKASESEIKGLNTELEQRIQNLTELNRELEAFGYSISHDLRAPLRSIRSFTQFLREHSGPVMDEESGDYLRRVESAAKYMDLLLLDLLQYSRLNSSDLEMVPVDLDGAARDVIVSIQQEIEDRKAQIQIHGPLGSVKAHPATVRQVFYNLISNGLKFVPAEQVPQIEIRADQQGGAVKVWVADSGIGIAPQFHQKIFGLFQRLHSHEAFPGTGIGLALVRKGVERMGGRVGLDSDVGKGTRFWFELPAAGTMARQAEPQPASIPAG